ncbi:MAG: hypothetical protein H0Z28_05280 [Archaeoglobus sp.]|nr:hypothetical protein [Archaeoglobus sp.]
MAIEVIGYIISAIPGIVSLYLYWKKIKKEEPKINFQVIKGSYRTEKEGKSERLIFDISLLFENKGNASGSVTDLIALIRYSEKAIKMYPFIYSLVAEKLVISERPINYEKVFPLEIGPYGSKVIEVNIIFNEIYSDFLDRCNVAINLREPKKWEWKDLPIYIRMTTKTTLGSITHDTCLFRADLPESKKIRGTMYPLEESDIIYEFSPKIEL